MVSIYYVLLDGLVFILIDNGIGFHVKAGSFEQTDTGFEYVFFEPLVEAAQTVSSKCIFHVYNIYCIKLLWL